MEVTKDGYNTKDHDLLVRLDQKVGDLILKVDNLQDGTVSKIELLFRDKADRKEVEALQDLINENIEVRVRQLEGCKIDPNEHKSILKKTDNYLIVLGLYTIFVGGLTALILYHIFYKG